MDNIDYKILRCLKDNARLTASAISEEINLCLGRDRENKEDGEQRGNKGIYH